MEPTTHYQLKKWDAHDRVLRQDFNDNYDKLDGSIYNVQLSVNNVQSLVGNLQTVTQSQGTSITNLQSAMTKRGNCRVEQGSYTGAGVNGQAVTLTFSRKPLLVLVQGPSGYFFTALQGCGGIALGLSGYPVLQLTWSGNGVSWIGDNRDWTFDMKGTVYHYLALMIE